MIFRCFQNCTRPSLVGEIAQFPHYEFLILRAPKLQVALRQVLSSFLWNIVSRFCLIWVIISAVLKSRTLLMVTFIQTRVILQRSLACCWCWKLKVDIFRKKVSSHVQIPVEEFSYYRLIKGTVSVKFHVFHLPFCTHAWTVLSCLKREMKCTN